MKNSFALASILLISSIFCQLAQANIINTLIGGLGGVFSIIFAGLFLSHSANQKHSK